MKKRILSILLTVCMVLTLLPSVAQPAVAAPDGSGITGDGTSSNPYIITTADQLAYVAQQVNANVTGWVSASYKLGNSIDLSAYTSFEPIGRYNYDGGIYEFIGTFDGAGFAIKNLKVNTGDDYSSLFASVGPAGTVRNLAVIDSNIAGNGSYSGTIVGMNHGTIQNCYSNGTIYKTVDWPQQVGGIAGTNRSNGRIENCYFSGSVWAGVGTDVGPIVGGDYSVSKLVLNCYAKWSNSNPSGLAAAQMQGLAGATNDSWYDVTISGVNKGKISLVDALNQWVSAQAPGNFTPWYCTSADGNTFPGFVKEEFIVSISDGTGVGTSGTTAVASLAGAITSGATYVTPGETVTLTLGAPDSAHKDGTVRPQKTGIYSTPVTTTLISPGTYKFTMPRYPVTIVVSYAAKSTGNNISTFNFTSPAVSGTVNNSNKTVTVVVPYGTNVSSLSPSITVSTAATINPINGAAQNFTSDATYTVTAENGSSQNWTITVLIQTATPSDIGFDAVTSMLTGISDGMEYSVDGGSTWVTITGSVSGKAAISGVTTAKGIQVRNNGAAPHTAPSLASTIDITQAAPPSAPTISAVTANSVTLTPVNGNEYSKNGSTWQASNLFDNLNPATGYTFYQRVAASGTTLASIKSNGQPQYTAAAKPTAGVDYSINYETEKITVNNGYEVNTDAGFGAGTVIENDETLISGTTYYVRVAENGGVPVSEAASFTIPARPAAPTVISADKTKNSITITTVAGQEYKIVPGTGIWQDSGTFTGLSANTNYTVFARVKAVSSGSVSFASEECSKTIKTKSDGSLGFALPTISVSPTYSPNKRLNDITLPAGSGWAWSTPATVPTVTNSGYSAVYTPTDADTVDYSGVDGYALVDGKVTITKTILLTVKRATPTAADFTYTAPTTLGYDNTAKSATVTAKSGISGMGIITVKYYDKDGAVIDAPTHAGNYTVRISVAEGQNYATVTELTDSSAWTFTIAKVAQAPLSITNKPSTVITYGDTFTLASTGGSGTGAVTWKVTGGDSATVDASTGAVTVTGVGETTITATKAADGNYSAEVTDTYTFTPVKRQLNLAPPSATGGFTKSYDASKGFNATSVSVGNMTNKVGADTVTVAVQSASYDTSAVGAGNKALTITYRVEGKDSGKYLAPTNTVIPNASITAATPTIKLEKKIAVRTDKVIEIDVATVTGVGSDGDISKNYSGAIMYTYYTKEACAEADRTTADQSGAQTIGGAPKESGTYYVKAAIAAKGNYTNASSAPVTLTIYRPSSGGGTPATAENNSSSPVIVDGKVVEIGKSEVKGSTTTVKVDQNKLAEQIKNAKDSVFIPITAKTDTATAQLVVQNVEDMAAQKMALTVQSGKVSYNLDTAAIDTKALASAFSGTDTKLIPFQVTIANAPVKVEGANIIVPPVEFTITASYGGKTVEVDTFKSFINRTIEISAEQAKKITTAVVVEKDGTLRHVPTNVMQKNGKYYAVINSLTNSTYTLIENQVKFTDASGKWYEKAVNEMGSRKTIGGIGDNRFAGETSVTRAEFAAILVRALGLPTDSTAASVFTDVSSSQWYYGAVGTAYAYDLVSGKREDQFDPKANITRQEAMVMIARAAKVANYTGSTSSLADFSDADKLGSWAVDSAKFNVGAGLIIGNNANLRPQDQISRAETATVILRLLQKAELVDVRN